MKEKQQFKSVKVLISIVSAVLFIMCSQLNQPANAVSFYNEDGSILQSNITNKTPKMIIMAQAVNPNDSEYTVTYHPNGGKGQTIEVSVKADTEYEIEEQEYTRRGYIFTGWNTNPDRSGTTYYNGQVIDITNDVTLFAMWAIAF